MTTDIVDTDGRPTMTGPCGKSVGHWTVFLHGNGIVHGADCFSNRNTQYIRNSECLK